MKVTHQYTTRNSTIPRFYHLIKTHKKGSDIKIRPIVSNVNGPTYKISKLLCYILSPLLKDVPAHLMDSKQLLTDLNNINSEDLTKFNYPFSLDVTALYTSILPQEAIRNISREEQAHYQATVIKTNHLAFYNILNIRS